MLGTDILYISNNSGNYYYGFFFYFVCVGGWGAAGTYNYSYAGRPAEDVQCHTLPIDAFFPWDRMSY